MTERLSIRLDPTPAAVGLARGLVDRLQERVPDRTLGDARLLVSELVTNSLRHGSLRPDQPIELSLTIRDGLLRAEVRDGGEGFTPRSQNPEPAAESGWGLFLVAKLAARWGVLSDGSTRVWFELPISATASSDDR